VNKVNAEHCAVPDPIVIVDYSPSWPVEFERLRDRQPLSSANSPS